MQIAKKLNSKHVQNFVLLFACLTLAILANTQILSSNPKIDSIVFIDFKIDDSLKEPLQPLEVLALNHLSAKINQNFLMRNVIGETKVQRLFTLLISEAAHPEVDFFEIAIHRSKLNLNSSSMNLLVQRVENILQERFSELQLVGGHPDLIKQKREEFVWISCEPPTLKKISAMRKQVRRILFLQMCAPPDRSLAIHLKTNQIDRYLEANTNQAFARINVKSWETFEKWNGDLWKSGTDFKNKAGVVQLAINQNTLIKKSQAAIDVFESSRGIPLL